MNRRLFTPAGGAAAFVAVVLLVVGGLGWVTVAALRVEEAQRKAAKRPCPPGHFYCLKCQAPRPPAAAMTEYVPITPTSGNLKALCPECTGVMFRRIKEVDQERFCAELVITAPQAVPRLSECTDPSLIVHS